MEKTYLGINFLILSSLIFGSTEVSCTTSLRDMSKYSPELVSLKNIVRSVRHVVETRPETNMPHYCTLISSPPGGKSLTMMDMLRLTQKTVVIVNTWVTNSKGNTTVPNCYTCQGCENLIIFASTSDVPKIIHQVESNCTGARIELLVAIYETFASDREAQKFAKTIVDFTWKQLRGYATVLIPVDDRVLIFKSEGHVPFMRCEPEPPRVVSYLENNRFVGNVPFGRFRYNKCMIRGAMSNCWLLSRLVTLNGKKTVAGIEGQILEAVAENQNYTLEIIRVLPPLPERSGSLSSKVKISNSTFVREELQSGAADIGACSMWVKYRENMRFTMSYCANYVVLMIPLPKYIPFESILQTFGKPVWICIGASWIVGRILIRMNRRSISSLMALALFLGVSVTSQSRGFLEKWQMTLWVVYGYLITQSYIASLASVLNNPRMRKIETFEDLAASDIQVAGYPIEKGSFEIDVQYKRVVETFISIEEPRHTEMMNNPDKFLPDAQHTGILVDILLLNRHSWFSKYYQLKERITNLPLGMGVMTRSRLYLEDVDRAISALIENGLIPKWTDEDMLPPGGRRVSTDYEAPSPTLSLAEVAGIFVILIVGLLLSITVFIFELYKGKTLSRNSIRKILQIWKNKIRNRAINSVSSFR